MIKQAKKFGVSSAHIILPKKFIGLEVELLLPNEDNSTLSKKEIETLIDKKLEKKDE